MNFLTRILLVFTFVALNSAVISAQKPIDNSESPNASKMKQLDFLIGTWKGEGWIILPTGRETFTAMETLQPKLGGQIVVVDGLGKSIDKTTGKERIVHQAYGVFSYDPEADKIKFRWYKAAGAEEDVTTIDVTDKKFNWGFDVPENGVKVNFSEKINEKGNWLEIGEVSRDDGKTWFRFFQMELTKISN